MEVALARSGDAEAKVLVEGRQRIAGIGLILVALAAGAIDLFADYLGIAPAVGFGWQQGLLLLSAAALLVVGLVATSVPASYLSPSRILRALGSRRAQLLFVGAFAIGLAVRLLLLTRYGTQDPGVDLAWGQDVVSRGLAGAFAGNYFPLQYQEFASVAALADQFGAREIVLFKSVNLICDLALFVVLIILLSRFGRNPAWALLYWLNPYVVVLSCLGYVDFQIGLFALLVLLVVAFRPGTSAFDWLLAGIPLGVTLLLKPQSLVLCTVLALFVVASVVLTRRTGAARFRPILLFAAPALMFAAYSAYFWVHGQDLGFLVETYSATTDIMPSLSANMPNVWHIVGQVTRTDSADPVYTVTGPAVLHTIAKTVTILLLGAIAIVAARGSDERQNGLTFLGLLTAATLLVPMTMTQAHDNHMALGIFFLTLLIPLLRDTRLLALGLGLSVVLSLNIFARYGFDATSGESPIAELYPDAVKLLVAALASVLFIAIAAIGASKLRVTAPRARGRSAVPSSA